MSNSLQLATVLVLATLQLFGCRSTDFRTDGFGPTLFLINEEQANLTNKVNSTPCTWACAGTSDTRRMPVRNSHSLSLPVPWMLVNRQGDYRIGMYHVLMAIPTQNLTYHCVWSPAEV